MKTIYKLIAYLTICYNHLNLDEFVCARNLYFLLNSEYELILSFVESSIFLNPFKNKDLPRYELSLSGLKISYKNEDLFIERKDFDSLLDTEENMMVLTYGREIIVPESMFESFDELVRTFKD